MLILRELCLEQHEITLECFIGLGQRSASESGKCDGGTGASSHNNADWTQVLAI